MKNCILLLFLLLLPVLGWATHATGNDDSDTASDNASCNASFQENCAVETSFSSESVAAPVGIIGGGYIETLALIILLGSTIKAGRARKSGETFLFAGARRE
jgi:hypothetical protein